MSLLPLFSCFKSNSPIMNNWGNFPFRNSVTHFELWIQFLSFYTQNWFFSCLGFGLLSPPVCFTFFVISQEANIELEEKQDFLDFPSVEDDGIDVKLDENVSLDFSFTFKFPTFEEFSKNQKEISRLVDLVKPSIVSVKNFCESKSPEVSLESSEADANSNDRFLSSHHLLQKFRQMDEPRNDEFEDKKGVNEQMIVESLNEEKIEEMEETDNFEEEKLEKVHDESVWSVDSNSGSIASNNIHLPTNDLHCDDGFLSDGDFEIEFDEKELNNWTESNFLSEKDFDAQSRIVEEGTKASLKGDEKNSSNDTSNKLESLWEHQELIEQLKMEIKKVKAIGLPTIFEESESPPKIIEELKPWRIEEVYQSGGKMGEVHKLYKSYRERMRKFNILNYQKMYAIGFLQLKEPLQSTSSSKSPVCEITTLLTQSFTTTKIKKHENDPAVKFIKELQIDLEIVYVAQMCLSWEILHWQYEKALDIWESDTHGVCRFNDTAGEFQQFQVLMQRFIEDERFHGPRIQNYIKSRCVFRNLLQVPVIRADHSMSKRARSEVVTDITSDTLVEIMEESIRIFWRFVRADKYKRQRPAEFQKPEDSQFFKDLQKDLHKKERKLKEQLKSRKSILKKLKCREEEAQDPVLYFFCQVDMKLVSRVLQMSRLTTDQLVWCHSKLSEVSFVNKRIHVDPEPSFLLFPC